MTETQIREAAVSVLFRGQQCLMVPTSVAWEAIGPERRADEERVYGRLDVGSRSMEECWVEVLAHYQDATPDLAYVGLWAVLPQAPAAPVRWHGDPAPGPEIGEFEPHDWI